MVATLLNGKVVAQSVRALLKDQASKYNRVPSLGVILVGNRSDSESYVKSKKKACAEVGIRAVDIALPEETAEKELIRIITDLNLDPTIDGILVQMPLPSHMNPMTIIESIDPAKDVDGLHPVNIGKLSSSAKYTDFPIACTPRGIFHLLDANIPTLSGKVAVVIGRSSLVGIPTTHLLRQRNCTVIHCNSFTVDLRHWIQQADIIIAACGVPGLIKGEWIQPGAIVVDVGINYIPDASRKSGHRVVGDVCFEQAVEKAAFITPVPGGIGPMTIAMLLQNVVDAFERKMT